MPLTLASSRDLLQLRHEFNALNKMWIEVIFEIA